MCDNSSEDSKTLSPQELEDSLCLAEKMVLLHYDEETAVQAEEGSIKGQFSRSLALTPLLDLYDKNHITLEDGVVEIQGSASDLSSQPVLESAYKTISQAPKGTVKEWVADRALLGQTKPGFNQGMGTVYQRLIKENIVHLGRPQVSAGLSDSFSHAVGIKGKLVRFLKKETSPQHPYPVTEKNNTSTIPAYGQLKYDTRNRFENELANSNYSHSVAQMALVAYIMGTESAFFLL